MLQNTRGWILAGALPLALLAACSSDNGGDSDDNGDASADASADIAGDASADAAPDSDDVGVVDQSLNACVNEGTEGATASCLEPTMEPDYYVDQALRYFDTLDVDADRERIPNYHENVARWEWPPWLLLTALGRDDMNQTAETLRNADPSTVPIRDCRFFDTQPFARCYIEFEYEGGPCPIYEEFIFNDAGEVTWIEAWSHLPGMTPIEEGDEWAEDPNFPRLGNRIPGLGNATGSFDLESEYMIAASESDEEVADFALRATDWWRYWGEALIEAPQGFFGIGCGWEEE